MTYASSNMAKFFGLFPKCIVSSTYGRVNCSFKLPRRSSFFSHSLAYTCPALTVPSHGIKLGCPENATVYNGSVCQFSCNDGYIGSGSHIRRCQLKGTWSGQDFTCQSRYYRYKFANKYFNDENCIPSTIRHSHNRVEVNINNAH